MSNILETLQKMSESPHDYDIGYWWNAVDNAIEEIERLRGLLREIREIGWLQAPHPLTQRICKALGDD